MKKHDYAAALRYVETHGLIGGNHGSVEDDEIFDGVQATIIHALRFAEKMCGNLSQDTIQAGINSYNQNGHLAIVSHFKAMRDQALKELGE